MTFFIFVSFFSYTYRVTTKTAIAMKWHYIIITAALLITLPFQLSAAHCDEYSWNRSLKLQQTLDSKYNQHARRYNQFLAFHREQPFLYQEFSREEIRSFWRSNKHLFHSSMNAQISASQAVVNRIEQERSELAPLIEQVADQQRRWRAISKHCQQVDNQSNAITSLNYSQLNKALSKQIEDLLTKLIALQLRYQNEIEALEQAKQQPDKN